MLREWSYFWFEDSNGRSLSVIRLCFGIVVILQWTGLTNLLRFQGLFPEFPANQFSDEITYGNQGVRMAYPFFEWLPEPSITLHHNLELAIVLLAICWTIGLITRISGPLLALTYSYLFFLSQISYHHHTWHMVIVLNILGWSRTNEFFSLDNLLFSSKARRVEIFPLRMLQCLTTAVYFFAASSKLLAGWLDGRMLRILTREFNSVSWLHQLGEMVDIYIAGASMIILTMYFLSYAFWTRWKWHAFVVGLVLHFIIEVSSNVGTFTYQMWVVYLSFFYREIDSQNFGLKTFWSKLSIKPT